MLCALSSWLIHAGKKVEGADSCTICMMLVAPTTKQLPKVRRKKERKGDRVHCRHDVVLAIISFILHVSTNGLRAVTKVNALSVEQTSQLRHRNYTKLKYFEFLFYFSFYDFTRFQNVFSTFSVLPHFLSPYYLPFSRPPLFKIPSLHFQSFQVQLYQVYLLL